MRDRWIICGEMYRNNTHYIKECSNERIFIIQRWWFDIIRLFCYRNFQREHFSLFVSRLWILAQFETSKRVHPHNSSPRVCPRFPRIHQVAINAQITWLHGVCHFQIAPGLAVFSISEFKAVPRSRCNHLCDRRATISRQRSVTLYFFFLFSFLPSPFFSFSISATFSLLLLPSLYLFLRVFSFWSVS